MPKWTYYLTVYNQLDRPLKLKTTNIAWGDKESTSDNFPDTLEPGKSGDYFVYSTAGRSYGIEFYLTFNDVAPAGEIMYGTIQINVDMPYWKTANTSSCNTSGIIKVTGFQKVPDGAHDFATSITVFRSISQALE